MRRPTPHRTLRRTMLAAVAVLAVLATACSSDTPTATDSGDQVVRIDGTDIALTSSLSGFGSCDALLDHLRTEGAKRVGPWGFQDGWYGNGWPVPMMGVDDVAVETDMAAEAGAPVPRDAAQAGGETTDTAAADGAALTEGVDFSGTNVQEVGVDEADIVKTDGRRVVIVANGQLVVVDVATRRVTGTADVPSGDRAELFLSGDDILLVNQGWSGPVYYEGAPALDTVAGGDGAVSEPGVVEPELTEPDIAPDQPSPLPVEPGFEGSRTTITRLHLDGGVPVVLGTLHADGDYVSARSVEGTARIVVRSNPQYRFPFVYPQNANGEQVAENANREAILTSGLDTWLPAYAITDPAGDVTDEGLLVPCENVHAPTEFAGFGVLSVLSIPVDGELRTDTATAVLAPGDIVYASPTSVYVATTAWLPWDLIEADPADVADAVTTSIHRFDITSGDSAAYTASGSVDGLVKDRYSLSEYDGDLRVVTTTGTTWDETSESSVRVLRETDGALTEIGHVDGIGNGEAVQAVRFQGPIGYVVTFRQVDPFYTIDLSDPTAPTMRGELKIPGFSSYLHPIGDGLVLGVGSAADEATGQVTGAKVSLFDVRDPDAPTEIATWTAPDAWHDVGWDPRAFLWWEPEHLAVLPVQVWEQGQQWNGVVLLRVENDTITEVGRIDHADPNGTTGQTECRTLDETDLPAGGPESYESELEYMVIDNYGLVLDCGPGQARTVTGYECNPEPWMAEEAARVGIDVTGTLVMCWPIGDTMPIISRSMVLGDELWTVSSPWGQLGGSGPARLQVNDLGDFARLGAVDL